MAANKGKKITENSDLDAVLAEPGWVPVSPERLKEVREALKRPPVILRGGARPGAGRKPAGHVQMTVRVSPAVRSRIQALAKKEKRTISSVIEQRFVAA